MLNLTKILTAILACSMLYVCGCSKSGDSSKGSGDSTPGIKASITPEQQKAAVVAALPNADPSIPLDQYIKLTSGNQLMFMYYGLLNMPVDYDKIAAAYSQDFRNTSDEFKKKDIMNALKPRIDSEVAKAKQGRYFQTDFEANLGHFDFNAKGFPVNMPLDSNSYAWLQDNATYKYSFTNGDKFKLLKIEDEAKARSIESMVGKYPPLKLVFYAYSQDADPSNLQIKCQIVKVKLLDHKGNELLSL